MVDLSKLSADLRGRIEKIMDGDGQDAKKVDSRNEYNELSALLAGKGKVSGDEKGFVEGMLVDYQEEFMVRDEVKQRVRDLIKNGKANKADDNAEINDLKDYKKTKGLTKEEKNWIQAVIDGREVKNAEAAKNKEEVKPAEEKGAEEKKGADVNKEAETKEAEKNNKKEDRAENREFPPKEKPEPPFPPNGKTVPPFPPNVMPLPPNVINDNDAVNNNNNNNNVNQGGLGNININTKGDVTININGDPASAKAPEEGDEAGGAEKADGLTPKEVNEARKNGKDVADYLVGYTDKAEERLVSDIVREEVNEDNVMEFIKGYTENKGWGDHFFEQLESEYGFEEAQNIMRDVATKLKAFFEKNNQPEKALEIGVILENNGFTEEQAEKLDEIAQSGIKTPEKRKTTKFPTGGVIGLATGTVGTGFGMAQVANELAKKVKEEEEE